MLFIYIWSKRKKGIYTWFSPYGLSPFFYTLTKKKKTTIINKNKIAYNLRPIVWSIYHTKKGEKDCKFEGEQLKESEACKHPSLSPNQSFLGGSPKQGPPPPPPPLLPHPHPPYPENLKPPKNLTHSSQSQNHWRL